MHIQKEMAISIRGVKKSFKEKSVLNGVDLEIERGSIFALLGSNGAGKTTLIRMLTTLLQPDEGKIIIGGFDVQESPKKVKELISLTGQFATTDEGLTGRNNIHLIGELNHLDNVKERSDDLLGKFGLEAAADKRVEAYSGGMRRRLDIAMSMLSEPEIIFLDEPTTGLDPQNRAAMWELVNSLSESGTTIFLTTQYLEEAEVLADKVAILNEGRIVNEGTVEELKNILPQGLIEFSFQTVDDLIAVKKYLSDYTTVEDMNSLTLTIISDGTMSSLAILFNRVNESGVEVAAFTQKLPTLEEVFYKSIEGVESSDDSSY